MTENSKYPLPRAKTRVIPIGLPLTSEFGATREEYEEMVFRKADHFTVVKFTSHSGSWTATVKKFSEAVYLAFNEERALVYAADSISGHAVCIPRKEWDHYAKIWLEMHPPKEGANVDRQ